MKTRSILAMFMVFLLVAWTIWPPAVEARYQRTSGFNLFSRDQEVQAGQQANGEISKKLPVLPESDPITRYVQRLGSELAAHAPGDKWPFTFHVVNQKEINAFALPGGPVYVNLGTIQAVDNEAQLAGVMAHEISHVVQRHSTRAATKQMQAQLPLSILGGLLGGSMGAQAAKLGISFTVGSYFLKNSRSAEQEADLVGTDIMYDTGFSPHQMAVFFEKLENQPGGRAPQFLSDHPNPGNRAQRVSQEVNTLPPKDYRSDSAEFLQIKKIAAGRRPLTAQEIASQQDKIAAAPATTSTLGKIAASETFRSFDHSAYQVTYPDNWQLSGDDQSSVTIAPPGGITNDGVAYGVIISGYQPESGEDLDRATHRLIASMQQSNPGLRTIGNDEDIRVGGVAGKSVDMIGNSPIKPQRERDWLVTLPERNGNVVYLVFVSPEGDFDQLHPVFETMLRSLRLK
ncbi:MAG TPA: M48 family metalloprotease [Alphaproteobacteria bacterium]|nr:M48 family metalloprotease [Alphaproteobacteria bacterium]